MARQVQSSGLVSYVDSGLFGNSGSRENLFFWFGFGFGLDLVLFCLVLCVCLFVRSFVLSLILSFSGLPVLEKKIHLAHLRESLLCQKRFCA